MPAITFGPLPVRPDIHLSARHYRFPSPYPAAHTIDVQVAGFYTERQIDFCLPPTPCRSQTHLALEREPTPYPEWPLFVDGRAVPLVLENSHGFKACVKKWATKVLVCCGLKKEPRNLATNF